MFEVLFTTNANRPGLVMQVNETFVISATPTTPVPCDTVHVYSGGRSAIHRDGVVRTAGHLGGQVNVPLPAMTVLSPLLFCKVRPKPDKPLTLPLIW